jgi:glutaminase
MADGKHGPDPDRLSRVVKDVTEEMFAIPEWGKASDFLPELAEVDVHQFGMAVLTCDGQLVTGGDADTPFTLQSISKVFSLTLALEAFGDKVWERVGREPSGDPYNSIVDLERHEGYPRNPFINPGALVVIDMLVESRRGEVIPDFVHDRLVELLQGETLEMDDKVMTSEESSSFTNKALANLAKGFGNFHCEVDEVMKAYVRQCAIALNCRQLAKAGRYLMAERVDADSREALEEVRRARRVASLMLTCGQYDGSGDFAFRVGLPAKSGVSGGILAIVPNIASIAVWSPGLDENGNSLLGTLALERLAEEMDWSVFGATKKRS